MTTVPLNRLRFGDDYPGGSINARKTKSEDGLPELLATILDKGLIHALIVRTHANGKVYVAEGNRRLRALRLGVQQGRLEKNHPVKVEEMAEGVDALELSLTANIMRLPMHEVDQYEAFVELVAAGSDVAAVASRFGTSILVVTRRLALGGLSPKLRQAWRENRITAETAMAFTNSQDHALQDQVYTSLAQGQMLHRHSILRALTRSDLAGNADLRFVGTEAYLSAGGRLVEDLFAEEAHVLDGDLLRRLEREKLEAVCAGLLADGWSWAALANDLPPGRWNWPKLDVTVVLTDEEAFRLSELKPAGDAQPADNEQFRAREAARVEAQRITDLARIRSFTADQKAYTGCVVRVLHGGRLDIEYGVQRPGSDLAGTSPIGAEPADGGDADEPAAPGASGPEISGALAQTVSEWTTAAAANALADEPDLALRVLLAAWQSYGAPARINRNGWSGLLEAMNDKPPARDLSFASALADTMRAGKPHLMAAIAAEVARSLDLTVAAAAHPAQAIRGAASLIDALDGDGYLAAARRAFDAGVYFDRAPAAVALAAIDEMGGPKTTGKKGIVALAAADLARDLGWLPPGMRSSAYVPPTRDGQPAQDRARGARSRGRAQADAAASA